MPQAWHLRSNVTDMGHIHRSDRSTRLNTGIRQDRSPGIDHHGVPMAVATVVMMARLGRSQHVGRVLNGAGLKQNLPVVLAGESCECCLLYTSDAADE